MTPYEQIARQAYQNLGPVPFGKTRVEQLEEEALRLLNMPQVVKPRNEFIQFISSPEFLIVGLVVLVLVLFILVSSRVSSSSSSYPPKTIEDYAQDEARDRAIGRAAEARGDRVLKEAMLKKAEAFAKEHGGK